MSNVVKSHTQTMRSNPEEQRLYTVYSLFIQFTYCSLLFDFYSTRELIVRLLDLSEQGHHIAVKMCLSACKRETGVKVTS